MTARFIRSLARFVLPAMVLGAVFLLDAGAVMAQANTCSRLSRTLNMLERNNDFQNLDAAGRTARALAQQIQQDQSSYVRGGCQAIQNSGQRLPPQCQAVARRILQGRRDYQNLSQRIQTGNAVAQQREQVLQQIARFDCGSAVQRRPRSFFDQLFGPYVNDQGPNSEGDIIQNDDGYGYYNSRPTIRTMCVRLADGYYFPISYATLPEDVPQDAQTCQERCPGANVALYYYRNPGQEVEQMVDEQGQPYTALPNAFAYRKAVDPNASCKADPATQGDITVINTPDGKRNMVDVNGREFPLPPLDPRRQQQPVAPPVQVAQAPSVPLPRPRPGTAPAETAPLPVKPPVATKDSRIVEIAGKKVRIVGPDTPYGRPVGEAP